MTIRFAVVDLRALPAWSSRALAARDVWEAADRHFTLRMQIRDALAPSPFQVLRFTDNVLAIVHVSVSGQEESY